MVVKFAIARHTLAKAHLLYVGNEQFYLIVGNRRDYTQEGVGMGIVHAHDIHKCHIVECLGTAILIYIKRKDLTGIMKSGIKITIVVGIGKGVQPVRLASILMRTS